MSKRQKLQSEAVVSEGGFEFKGVKYKSPSLRSIRLLEIMETACPSASEMDIILRTLYSLSKEYKEIKNDLENLEEVLLDFAGQFTTKDLEEISELLTHQQELINSVDYTTTNTEKKPTKE